MELEFLINPRTGLPQVEDHGISSWEVADVMAGSVYDVPANDGARAATGKTHAGIWIRVIYTQASRSSKWFVITAYEPSSSQLRTARRRLRNK